MIWTSLLIVVTYIALCSILGFIFQVIVWIKEKYD
jgi:hypothetical protein